jgi:hypothetical protein
MITSAAVPALSYYEAVLRDLLLWDYRLCPLLGYLTPAILTVTYIVLIQKDMTRRNNATMSPINNPNGKRHTAVNRNNEDPADLMAASEAFSYEDITARGDHSGSDTMSNGQEVYTPSTTSNSQVVYTPSLASEDIARKKYSGDDDTVIETEPLLQASPPPSCYQDNPSDPLVQPHQAVETGKCGQGISRVPGMIPARECNAVWSPKNETSSKAGEDRTCRRWLGRCCRRERRRGRRRCACTGTKIIVFLFKLALLVGLLIWLFKDKFRDKVRFS